MQPGPATVIMQKSSRNLMGCNAAAVFKAVRVENPDKSKQEREIVKQMRRNRC
jgi:hypothetical protein